MSYNNYFSRFQFSGSNLHQQYNLRSSSDLSIDQWCQWLSVRSSRLSTMYCHWSRVPYVMCASFASAACHCTSKTTLSPIGKSDRTNCDHTMGDILLFHSPNRCEWKNYTQSRQSYLFGEDSHFSDREGWYNKNMREEEEEEKRKCVLAMLKCDALQSSSDNQSRTLRCFLPSSQRSVKLRPVRYWI
jgi:hypothetical protein